MNLKDHSYVFFSLFFENLRLFCCWRFFFELMKEDAKRCKSGNSYCSTFYLAILISNNFIPVVKKHIWISGVTYDMYRPDYNIGNGELIKYPIKLTSNSSGSLAYDSTFYVMNQFYQVYKCLYNGQTPENPLGVSSTVEPVGVSTSPFITNDGYRWKYLYTIPSFYVLKV